MQMFLMYKDIASKLLTYHTIWLINQNKEIKFILFNNLDDVYISAFKFKLFDLIIEINKSNEIYTSIFKSILKIADYSTVEWLLAQKSVNVNSLERFPNLEILKTPRFIMPLICSNVEFGTIASRDIKTFLLLIYVYQKKYNNSDLWYYIEQCIVEDSLECFKYFHNLLNSNSRFNCHVTNILSSFGRKTICEYAIKNNIIILDSYNNFKNIIENDNREFYKVINSLNFKIINIKIFEICIKYKSVFFFEEFLKRSTINKTHILNTNLYLELYYGYQPKIFINNLKLNLEMIKYLNVKGCPKHPFTVILSIEENNFELFKYLIEDSKINYTNIENFNVLSTYFYLAFQKDLMRISIYIINNLYEQLIDVYIKIAISKFKFTKKQNKIYNYLQNLVLERNILF